MLREIYYITFLEFLCKKFCDTGVGAKRVGGSAGSTLGNSRRRVACGRCHECVRMPCKAALPTSLMPGRAVSVSFIASRAFGVGLLVYKSIVSQLLLIISMIALPVVSLFRKKVRRFSGSNAVMIKVGRS